MPAPPLATCDASAKAARVKLCRPSKWFWMAASSVRNATPSCCRAKHVGVRGPRSGPRDRTGTVARVTLPREVCGHLLRQHLVERGRRGPF